MISSSIIILYGKHLLCWLTIRCVSVLTQENRLEPVAGELQAYVAYVPDRSTRLSSSRRIKRCIAVRYMVSLQPYFPPYLCDTARVHRQHP